MKYDMKNVRVLLAGNNAKDLVDAEKFLRGKGFEVFRTCSQKAVTELILHGDRFDVAVVEASSSKYYEEEDLVDGLTVLQMGASCPVAIALDFENDAECQLRAVELGAVDLLPKPISTQEDRLSTLWQHSLRRKGYCCTRQAEESDQADEFFRAFVCFGDDVEDEGLTEDEAVKIKTEPGTYIQGPQSDSENSKIIDTSGDSSSLEFFGKQGSTSLSRSIDTFLTDDQLMQAEEISGGVFSESYTDSDCGDPDRARRLKVDWSDELHEKFVAAVEFLGSDKAVPSRILECMGPCSKGLTRQNIASHLQKYRNRKRMRERSESNAATSKLMVHGVFSMYPGHGPMAPHAMPCWVPGNPAAHYPGGFVPMGGGTRMAPAAFPLNLPAQPTGPPVGPTQAPAAEQVFSAIEKILKQPKVGGALGLKLDLGDILEQLNSSTRRKLA